MAFKENRITNIRRREQLDSADKLREYLLVKNHFGIMLYQWRCVQKGLLFLRRHHHKVESSCFNLWIRKYTEIKHEQRLLNIGSMHWRQKQLRMVITDWSSIAHQGQTFKRYLSNAQRKYNRKVISETFDIWCQGFNKVVRKKQILYELELKWNQRNESVIFNSWIQTARANAHYKLQRKTRSWTLWRTLYHHHIAARYEREKHLNLCITIFAHWQQRALALRKKQQNLDELFQCFIDWKTQKVVREWKRIRGEHRKARKHFAVSLQRKALRRFMESVAISKRESMRDFEFADIRYRTLKMERAFTIWINRYELHFRKRQFLEKKCEEYCRRRSQRRLLAMFKWWISRFHIEVNERQQMDVSAGYRDHYVVSKVFVQWKLFVKTSKFKNKMMTKSMSSLRHSVLMKSRNQHKLSASQSYIRLSHQSFGSTDFKNYLRMKGQGEEHRLNDSITQGMGSVDDDPDESYLYDSVLLKSASIDSTYH